MSDADATGFEAGVQTSAIELEGPPSHVERFKTLVEYQELEKWLNSVKEKSIDNWMELVREYGKWDLYYLCRYLLMQGGLPHNPLGNVYLEHDIFVDWCRQTERHMELYTSSLDYSCRRTGKSFIRSLGVPIQLMLRYPDISMCLFSTEMKLGVKHVGVLQGELEKNRFLTKLYDDIFWDNPREEAKKSGVAWSRVDGLCIKGRKMNRSTQTFECHAMFGGGPVGAGYDVIFFDDCETSSRVASKESIEELDRAYSAAISLLTPIAVPRPIVFMSNTRFSPDGLVQRKANQYLALNADSVRGIPGEDIDEVTDFPDHYYTGFGPLGGRVVYPNTPNAMAQKYLEVADKSEYVLQYCGSYKKASDRALNGERINFYDDEPKALANDCHAYLCIDTSRGVKDPTVLWVWGLTHDKRRVWLDAELMMVDPSKPQFHDAIFRMATLWNNLTQRMIEIRIEDTVNSTWSEWAERELRARGCYIPVRKVRATANNKADRKFRYGKMDRIYDRWAPMINKGEVWFPRAVSKGGRGLLRDDGSGNYKCLVDYFFDTEFNPFPVSKHDDMLDAGSLIEAEKVNAEFPLQFPAPLSWRESDSYDSIRRSRWSGLRARRGNDQGTSWMSGGG